MKKTVKQALRILTATGVLAWPLLGTVVDAKTTHYQMQKETIVLNDKTVSAPSGFAASNTMYMPIWYVMQALQSLGVQSTWKNNVWNMTVPKTMTVDMSKVQIGTGAITLEIGGKAVHKVNGIAAPDPSTGKNTTFIPIWYIQQLLNRLGITSGWDGKTWTMSNWPDGHPITPPPTLPANEVATWQMLSVVEKDKGIQPDSTGKSPYDDIGSKDTHWGVVQAAVKSGLITPSDPTHSGAYDALTVGAADQILWNATGMTDASFEPGGDPFDWANVTGLNPPNLKSTDLVTPQEFSDIMSNLADNANGFHQISSASYQILYPIENEANATFAGDSLNGQAFYTTNQAVQQAISQVYQFFDHMTVTKENGIWVLSMPNLFGTSFFSTVSTMGTVQYALPGDTNWSMTQLLDTRQLASSSTGDIRVQIPADNGLTISVNQMMPTLGGTVFLGQLQIDASDSGVTVTR